ncbi:MAG: sigma-70 family RNA polymerase sigma factor [Cyclobacteriaceae bacterium]
MITVQEENSLIDKIIQGDHQLYAQLVDRYKSYAFTIAYKVTESKPDAEEVAQDAFIKAYQYLKSFKRDSKFSTWLYRIVFNTAVSYRRKKRPMFDSIEKAAKQESESQSVMEQDDKSAFIEIALSKLNELDRLSIQLYYLKEFSMEEVAEVMNQKLNTTKVRVHRARIRLAEELKGILKDEALTL